MKIYSDDPDLPYKTTDIKAQRTKMMIDQVLGKWGVKDFGWHWDPENNDVFVEFQITENFNEAKLAPWIRVVAPVIWNKSTRKTVEAVNWDISLRVMYWFIKTHLEAAYLLQSQKTMMFLPLIKTGVEGKTLGSIIISNLERIQGMPALEEKL